MIEKWDVYSVDRMKLNKKVSSDSELKCGEYRLVVGACIFNTKNELLVQKRQKDKKSWADYWDISVSGSVIFGETSSEGMMREIKEELGLVIDIKNRLPQLSINFTNGFEDYYIIESDFDIAQMTIQEEEIQEVAWMSLAKIKDLMKKNQFISYHQHLIELFFEMKTQYGSYKIEG